MTTLTTAGPDRATAGVAVGTAAVFAGAFALLGATFDYPAVLEAGPAEILTRFAAAGSGVRVLWYLMLVASLAFVPLAVLLGRSLAARLPQPSALLPVAVTAGVLAGAVQAVGFARWTFAMPWLATTFTDPASGPATRDAVLVVTETLNRLVGGGFGEHLGFGLTAVWTGAVAVLLARAGGPRLLAVAGLVAAAAIATGTLEVTGATWPGVVVAAGYTLFALWLVAVAAVLLRRR